MNWLKEFRKKKKITQKELSKEVGISQGNVSKIENEIVEANIYLLIQLRIKYNFNVNKLLTKLGVK